MADNYWQCTPTQDLAATKEEATALHLALAPGQDFDYDHGFQIEFDKDEGRVYVFAEAYGDPWSLSEAATKLLGVLIEREGLPYLEFGYAFTCSKMRPGEFGGGKFRIYPDGSLVFPENTVWPEKEVKTSEPA